MALTKLQEVVERSLFEVIRKILVAEGYTPDITNTIAYGSAPYSKVNQTAWNAALNTITTAKGFAIEVFNNSQSKGTKAVPRIVIIPRRTLPGDIGSPQEPYYSYNPADPLVTVKTKLPLESSHFYYDISLISNTADQDRVIHAVVAKAFGVKKFIPYYTDPTQFLFIRQISDFDLPDPLEGISERVFSYELPDLFDVQEDEIPVALTKEIDLTVYGLSSDSNVTEEGNVINGEKVDDGKLHITKDGISFT